jgi:hypothetical protein
MLQYYRENVAIEGGSDRAVRTRSPYSYHDTKAPSRKKRGTSLAIGIFVHQDVKRRLHKQDNQDDLIKCRQAARKGKPR